MIKLILNVLLFIASCVVTVFVVLTDLLYTVTLAISSILNQPRK